MQRWLTNRTLTVNLLVGSFMLLIAWDAWIYWGAEDTPATISRVIHGWGTRLWWVLVAFGVLLGHFFWPQEICGRCPHCRDSGDVPHA
jgi:hypothetical protein